MCSWQRASTALTGVIFESFGFVWLGSFWGGKADGTLLTPCFRSASLLEKRENEEMRAGDLVGSGKEDPIVHRDILSFDGKMLALVLFTFKIR